MIPELMATRERVAWIFHEKARRLHSEANNGKKDCMLCWDGAFCESEIARKEALHYAEQRQTSARARSQVRRSTTPNGDAVRGTGKRGPRFRAPFCGASSFEGGSCQKSGSRGCAQGRAVQATRITLGPNRVLGRYVDVALAWGVIGRSNGIPYPDAIKHLFTVPL